MKVRTLHALVQDHEMLLRALRDLKAGKLGKLSKMEANETIAVIEKRVSSLKKAIKAAKCA